MLAYDYDLKASEIQQLAGADPVVGLFTALGYATDRRAPQTPAALGFPESLAREVLRIECIADQEDGALQVYLVELKRVTVALTQSLARAFKGRFGLFLLVLTTSDYQRLDFVLLEHLPALDTRSRSPQDLLPLLRPRILSVDRRNPDRVSLRVLRRFSYTEVDADYQWDKLRSAYSVAEWSEPLFNNRALFSDYYLNERLPMRGEWKEDPHLAYRALNDLLVDARQKFARQPEGKLRTTLFEPIFKTLGWQAKANKASNDSQVLADYDLVTPSGARVPCLTYVWDRTLDGLDGRNIDAETPSENPAQTVVSVLEAMHAEAAGWAIVTNGKVWRLYSARAHSRATNYYEIDLEETLASPDVNEAFRFFWLLFRAQAFDLTPQPGILDLTPRPPSQTGKGELEVGFLDSLLLESASYAKALGERLKNNVFEKVFPLLAEGFIKNWGKPAVELAEDDLRDTFHATLTFLYRLLFLLYAEARDLLPVKEARGYWEISLKRLKDEIAKKGGEIADLAPNKLKEAYSVNSADLYDRLSKLFQVIDRGDPDLNVPVYNGGLFITLDQNQPPSADETEAEELRMARFLTDHKIPDRLLAQGLDLLARDIDEKTQALAMIDYKSLGVRQLGSIYEGLLEFKLRIAHEKMAVVSGKKGDQIIPYAEARAKGLKLRMSGRGAARTEFVYPKGKVYLENDLHERKATGSYYTPDYIVKYIVQHTVGPALEAKSEALRPKLRAAQKAYHAAVERQKAFLKAGQKGDDPEKTAYTYHGLVDELFDLRVLDPAMGSGHFLVEAVDFITDRLLAFLNAFPWNPVTAALRQTRQTILEEMQRQSVNVDPARLTDVNLLKRHVLKRCIYGVDLNPMAVELAKVSLWLDCFTLGAPLSFLDHHLKCGNSLIGAQVKPVREEIEMVTITRAKKVAENAQVYKTKQEVVRQFQMFGSMWAGAMLATDLMRQVGELSDATAEQVHQSRAEYQRATDALAPFKRILNVYTSRWFGNPDVKLSQPVMQFLRHEGNIPWLKDPQHNPPAPLPGYQEIADAALKVAREKRFFHWELEFPEVFFGPSKASAQEIVFKDNPGFDAVIGNPPYDELSEDALGRIIDEKEFIDAYPLYKPAQESGGRANWYHFFMILGLKLVKNSCKQGFIVPMSWIGDTFTSGVRIWLLKNHRPLQIDCFPQKDDPKNRVFEATKLPTAVYIAQKERNDGCIKVRRHPGKDILNIPFYEVDVAVLGKLNPVTVIIPITSVVGWEILKSVATSEKLGAWEKFSAQPTSGEIIFNDDTRPYMTEDNSFDLILRGGHIQRYELLDDARQGTPIYLKTMEYLATSRGDSKAFAHKKPRVVYQEGSAIDAWRRIVATYLPAGYICGHKVCYFVDYKVDSFCLLAIFSSKFINWLVESLSVTNSLPAYLISSLPFPKFSFNMPAARREALVSEAKDLTGLQDLSGLIRFVEARLNTQPEESDVVHDVLAFLAQRMIDLNRQKQAEMKRFLAWLEGLLNLTPQSPSLEGLRADRVKQHLKNLKEQKDKSCKNIGTGMMGIDLLVPVWGLPIG